MNVHEAWSTRYARWQFAGFHRSDRDGVGVVMVSESTRAMFDAFHAELDAADRNDRLEHSCYRAIANRYNAGESRFDRGDVRALLTLCRDLSLELADANAERQP